MTAPKPILRHLPCDRSYDEDHRGFVRYASAADVALMRRFDARGEYPLWDHLRWFTQLTGRQSTHHVRRRFVRVVAYANNDLCCAQIAEALRGPFMFVYQAGRRASAEAICGVFCGPDVHPEEALAFAVDDAVRSGQFALLS